LRTRHIGGDKYVILAQQRGFAPPIADIAAPFSANFTSTAREAGSMPKDLNDLSRETQR
jgi:hypothetical protein